MSDYKLSVIIPVYNRESFLDSCLRSVAAQTLDNIEVIIINDGSTDNSLDIARSFEQQYHHFFVFNQKNSGLSAARNTGLNRARGQYITFLDSDDFIDPAMYEILYRKALESKSELVKCGAVLFENNSGRIILERSDFESYTEISSKKIILEAYLDKKIMRNVWNGIYHNRLLKDLRFPEGKLYEDHYLTPNILTIANSYVYVPKNYYYYRKHPDGITKSSTPRDRADKVQSLNELYRLICVHGLQSELSFSYSTYFYEMILEYHNSVIYSEPGYLHTGRNAINNIIDDKAFEYVFSYDRLTRKEKQFLQLIRRSHYLYFLIQKLNRFKEVLLKGDTLFKAPAETNNGPHQLNERYKEMIRLYA